MTRRALVLRPAPGNARTVAALEALGIRAVVLPLFRVTPCRWDAPDRARFDALLLTSANAARHAGEGLRALNLPVVAVGEATAAAARAAGLSVEIVGTGDAAAVVAHSGARRLLHAAGREHVALPGVETIVVYASDAVEMPADAIDVALDSVVLLHSRRAAARFAALLGGRNRARIRVAALSSAVAEAVGTGWEALVAPPAPNDPALVALAARLAIDP